VNPVKNNEIELQSNVKNPIIHLVTVEGKKINFSTQKTDTGLNLKGNFAGRQVMLLTIKGEKLNKVILMYAE
jgi:hypothetical protein